MEQSFDWFKAIEIASLVIIGVLLIWTIIVPIVAFQYLMELMGEE